MQGSNQQRRTTGPLLSAASWRIIGAAVLACLVLATADLDLRAGRALELAPIPRKADNLLLPPVPVLRATALGHDTLAASLLWIKAISYFGEHLATDREYRWLDVYINTIMALDPKFRKLFEWAGVAVMYGGRIDNHSVRASNRILELGLERFPTDWQLAFMLGCNYVFELHETDPERKNENIARGLTYLRRASYSPGAPKHLHGLVSRLYRKLGWLEVAAAYLEEAYLHTTDDTMREEIAGLLERYRSESQIAGLEAEADAFDRAWKSSFPYLPPGLFRLVGAPSSAAPLGRIALREELEETEQAPFEMGDLFDGDAFGGGLREGAVPSGRSAEMGSRGDRKP